MAVARKRVVPSAESETSEEAAAVRGWEPMRHGSRITKALLCTLGPSSLRPETINELEAAGVTGFRINMSHTDLRDLEKVIRLVQRSTTVPICLDTEGAQIRTGRMKDGVTLVEGSRVRLVAEDISGDAKTIPITPGDVLDRMEASTRMSIDFDSVVLRVDRVEPGVAEATVVFGGDVGTHKAVTAFPTVPLPSFSDKDLRAIETAMYLGVRGYALSFCESPGSVTHLRELVGSNSTIIAKVESRKGVRALPRIAQYADVLLIDRGDLSREVRLEALPLLQKAIIRKANVLGVPVYVATNLLESMVTRRTPTRAELNDVMNTLMDGANGLVLASETAIGEYPVEAARMVMTLIAEYQESVEGYRIDDLLGDHPLAVGRTRRGLRSNL